jgi:antitoxin VapB
MIKRKARKVSGKSTGKKKRMTVKEMLALGRRFRKSIKGPLIDHAELLYDEKGLPK